MDAVYKSAIMSTLGYYDHFKYPLTAGEILGNMPRKCSMPVLTAALDHLTSASEIHCFDGFYCLNKSAEALVVKRRRANEMALAQVPATFRIGRLIYKFPFVKFIGISGSLSKGYADENSDFDFFIVTEENRLWICRTILHLFKKLTFLTGSQHKFCMNYFIDTSRLEIEEQNRYTAIELASVIPVAGEDVYDRLKASNLWVDTFLPNGYLSFILNQPNIVNTHSRIKKMLEFCLNHIFPARVNQWLMTATDKKWRKKWERKNYPMEDYDCAFKTTLHISKNHPANHQKRVLETLSKFKIPEHLIQEELCLEG